MATDRRIPDYCLFAAASDCTASAKNFSSALGLQTVLCSAHVVALESRKQVFLQERQGEMRSHDRADVNIVTFVETVHRRAKSFHYNESKRLDLEVPRSIWVYEAYAPYPGLLSPYLIQTSPSH